MLKITSYILRLITWERIRQLLLYFILCIIIITVWEISKSKYDSKLSSPVDLKQKPVIVSKDISSNLNNLSKKLDHITAIAVVTFDFTRNIRIPTLVIINDKTIQKAYDSFVSRKTSEIPIFGSDKENNQRILRMMKGEFICIPFKDSLTYKAMSYNSSLAEEVCMIGIPPNNSDNIGLISIYTNRKSTKEEQDEIFLFLRDIATQIYEDTVR